VTLVRCSLPRGVLERVRHPPLQQISSLFTGSILMGFPLLPTPTPIVYLSFMPLHHFLRLLHYIAVAVEKHRPTNEAIANHLGRWGHPLLLGDFLFVSFSMLFHPRSSWSTNCFPSLQDERR
jgi:hypothetical protein